MIELFPGLPFSNLRRGCCGCALVLLLLAILAGCGLGFGVSRLLVTPAKASSASVPHRVVRLAPAIREAPRRRTPFGVFFEDRVAVEIGSGPVVLASTPDGMGWLVTDDRVTLQVTRPDGSQASWSHDFRSRDRSRVIPIPPQKVTALFRPGSNQVVIILEDLTPFTYSSSPYYLIVAAPEPQPTVTATSVPTQPATPTIAGTLAPGGAKPLETSTPPPTPAPAPTTWPIGAGGGMQGPDGPDLRPPEGSGGAESPGLNTEAVEEKSSPGTGMIWRALLLGVLAFAALLGTSVLVVQHARRWSGEAPQATMFGWLELFDRETQEDHRLVDLTAWPQGLVIQLDPLRVGPPGDGVQGVAEVRPTAEGICLVVTAGESEEGGAEGRSYALKDGSSLLVRDRLEVRFRSPQIYQGVEVGGVSAWR